MMLKLTRGLVNQVFIRRFASKDSSITTTDSSNELMTEKKSSEISTPKRAFTLIDPKTVHQIKRIDEAPIKNEMDLIRYRLTENRKSTSSAVFSSRRILFIGVKNIPVETDILIIGGAIKGSAIAYFLKQRLPDLKITVLERDWNVR
jgi:hypothetical protein